MNLNRALAQAKRIEDTLRERAFLPVPESINGVTVKELTLRHLNILFQIRSPFLVGGQPQIEDVGTFLWVVSPQYSTQPEIILLPFWRRFWLKVRRRLPPTVREVFMAELVLHPRWHLFSRAIGRYLDRAFMDRPPSVEGSGKKIAASYAAGALHKILSAYGGDDELWLDKPIRRLFQYGKWIDAENDPKMPQFNPLQDRIIAKAL